MKIEELRIGNYIEDLDHPELITHTEVDIALFVGLDIGTIDVDDIKPIPITDEWLVKLGFEEKKDEDLKSLQFRIFHFFLLYSDEQDNFSNVSLMYIDERAEYDSFGTFNDFKYVHQLQNLYHALTGEELTVKHGTKTL